MGMVNISMQGRVILHIRLGFSCSDIHTHLFSLGRQMGLPLLKMGRKEVKNKGKSK